MTDWKNQYTPEQLEVIQKAWRGKPPEQCTGKCQIESHFLTCGCKGCGWSDDVAVDGLDNIYN